jgi:hypothetical protein
MLSMHEVPDGVPDWLKEILAKPTCTVPEAGRAVGIEGRNQSYEAAKRGEIPVMRYGRLLKVPTRWVRKQLMLD